MAPPLGSKKLGGRKKGTPNKVTAKKEREIAQSGLTPLEYMLSLLRDETKSQEVRFEAAKAAAPYVHPKLAAIQHSGTDGKPIEHTHEIVDAFTGRISSLVTRARENAGD
jgi:hypothetical protein